MADAMSNAAVAGSGAKAALEMPSDAPELAPGYAAAASVLEAPRRNRKKLFTLQALDTRTAAYRDTKRLISAIEGDLGGADQLSVGERQLAQHAAILGAVLTDLGTRWLKGEKFDTTTYCAIVNCQRRVFEALGLKRRPRDVSPDLPA